MLSELQSYAMKKIKKTVMLLGVSLIILLVIFGGSFYKLARGPVDLYSLSLDELEGEYIEADINVILDVFAEYTETESGRTTTVKEYYIIPVGDAEYIGMGVGKRDLSRANKISNDTFEYIIGERDDLTDFMYVKGTIRKMNDELDQFYYEWFEETQFVGEVTRAEIAQYALNYVIEPNEIGIFENFLVYFALVGCAVLLVLIIVYLVKGLSGACLSQVNKFIRKNEATDSMEAIETDYFNAVILDKVRFGKSYTFYFKGSKACIVKNQEAVWAYLKRTTHKTNGIKTHTTYALILRTYNRGMIMIDMKSEDSVAAALQQYAINSPHIILGYSKDLEKHYNKNLNSFIEMGLQQKAAYERAAAVHAATNETTSSDTAAQGPDQSADPGANWGTEPGTNWGTEPAAAAPDMAADITADIKEQQGSGVSVILVSSNSSDKIMIIKTVREILGCGLKEAKDIVENVPSLMIENILPEDAQAIKAELEGLGAVVEIQQSAG